MHQWNTIWYSWHGVALINLRSIEHFVANSYTTSMIPNAEITPPVYHTHCFSWSRHTAWFGKESETCSSNSTLQTREQQRKALFVSFGCCQLTSTPHRRDQHWPLQVIRNSLVTSPWSSPTVVSYIKHRLQTPNISAKHASGRLWFAYSFRFVPVLSSLVYTALMTAVRHK